MFGRKEDGEDKEVTELPLYKYCPLRGELCKEDCAWLLDKGNKYVCSIWEIAYNT